jgi:hypothetical protein
VVCLGDSGNAKNKKTSGAPFEPFFEKPSSEFAVTVASRTYIAMRP